MTRILFRTAEHEFTADFDDLPASKKLIAHLPIASFVSTWGDEIYFSIPVKRGSEHPKAVVELGELGYWPPGNAFCIFYGATPGSTAERIEPASPVNPIGRISSDPKIFKTLARSAHTIRIEKV